MEDERIETSNPTWRDLWPKIASYIPSFPRKRESRVRRRVFSAVDSRLRGNDGFEATLKSIDGADVRVLVGMAEQESGSVVEDELIDATHPTWRDLWPESVA